MHMLKQGCVCVLNLYVDNKSYYATNGVVKILL
jgi:hypothetical protein